ncbi:MAG: prohibitin family protein [Flavobacteriales bacterium]|jgi:prohibitin 1|nr:prohibitin family protein [Flavobacteriales bacterium]
MAQYDQQQPIDIKKLRPLIIGGVVVVFFLLFGSKMTVTIDSGEAGVLFRTFDGGVDIEQTYGEGFHLMAPWNKMYIYEVRQQAASEKMSVLSSNGLEITLDVTLWFEPKYSQLGLLHQEKGTEYSLRVVKPAIGAATKSVIGRYTPEEIYSTKRDIIQTEIEEETSKILVEQYVQLNEVLVKDVTLPPTIKNAIETKLKQEQESLEYKFKIEKATKEAERQRIDAEGKAAANKILSESLTDKILKEKGIEATLELAKSPNAKTIVIGSGKDGLPLILGGQ